MSGETAASITGWTTDTLKYHMDAIRFMQDKFEAERDRRLAEVAIEREKALKIKETADLAALSLAREIQSYKDEKANELREQINRERNLYASKDDVAGAVRELGVQMDPLTRYVASQQGHSGGVDKTLYSVYLVLVLVATVVAGFVGHLIH